MRERTTETLDANIVVMEWDLAEILRLGGEQERLWKAFEEWKGRWLWELKITTWEKVIKELFN